MIMSLYASMYFLMLRKKILEHTESGELPKPQTYESIACQPFLNVLFEEYNEREPV